MGLGGGALVNYQTVLTDTHAHLDFPDFAPDLDIVLARAAAAGVHRIITIGTDAESCRRAIALADAHPPIHAVVGLHPCSAQEPGALDFLEDLPTLARHPKVVAIGETGLDYHHLPAKHVASRTDEAVFSALQAGTAEATAAVIADGAAKAAQAEAFRAQLDLAVELGLNVVVHQRESWKDTLHLLQPYTGKLRAVFHCFGGAPEDASELRQMGHLVSFTGIVTFKNAALVQETSQSVPADGYMVETDCPYLAPVPHRGKRCEPAFVRQVADKIAELRGEPLDKVAADTERTAREFFKI